MEKQSTKQRIIFAALDLFSEKGYDGVGVDQIADAVGIKGPSLYHHFKGKEEILQGLIDTLTAYYQHNFQAAAVPQCPGSLAELVEQGMGRITFTIRDPQIRKVRRLLAMEQFRNEKLKALTTWHHLTGLEQLYTETFRQMMASGLLQPGDPAMLALDFVAPVAMLVHLCDREPEREQEIVERIRAYMEHFARTYGKEAAQ